MKQIYLMLGPEVKAEMGSHEREILSYIRSVLNTNDNLIVTDKQAYISVEKLKSNSWQNYFSTAMGTIDECEFAVIVDRGYVAKRMPDYILEQYCKLTGIAVKQIAIDENTWTRIINGTLPSFIYVETPQSDF